MPTDRLTPQLALQIFQQEGRQFPPQGPPQELDLVDLFALQQSDDIGFREIGQNELNRRGIAVSPPLPTPQTPQSPFGSVGEFKAATEEQKAAARTQGKVATQANQEARLLELQRQLAGLREETLGTGTNVVRDRATGEPVRGTGLGILEALGEPVSATSIPGAPRPAEELSFGGPASAIAALAQVPGLEGGEEPFQAPLPVHATPQAQVPRPRFVPNRGYLGGGGGLNVEYLRGIAEPLRGTTGIQFGIPPSDGDPVGNEPDSGAGFIRSALSALGPETIGMRPSEDIERWRAENPGKSFASQVIGTLPALYAAPAALAKVPVAGVRFARALRAAGKLENVFTRGAATEALRFAPYELLGVSGALAFEGIDEAQVEAQEALINLGAAGAAGAFLYGVGSALKGAPGKIRPTKPSHSEELLQKTFPDYDLNGPAQMRMRQLLTYRESPAAKNPTVVGRVNAVIEKLRNEIRLEEPRAGFQAWVSPLAVGKNQRPLNDLLRGGRESGVRPLVEGQGVGFKLAEKPVMEEIAQRAKLPPDYEAHSQFHRTIVARDGAHSTRVRKALDDSLVQVENTPARSTYIGREKESGLYVVARKLKGRVIEGREGDLFDIFKTDNPGLFVPEAHGFAEVVSKHAFRMKKGPLLSKLERQIPVARDIVETKAALPTTSELLGTQEGRVAARIRKSLPGELGDQVLDMADYLKFGLKRFLAPTTAKYTDSPRAMNLAQIIRTAFAKANARVAILYSGNRMRPRDANLIRELFKDVELKGGIERHIDALTDEDLLQFTNAYVDRMTLSEARQRGLGDNVLKLMDKLDSVDEAVTGQVLATNGVIGVDNLVPLRDHRMISHLWRGGFRLEMREVLESGAPGEIVAYASGKNPGQVIKHAQSLAERVEREEGKKLFFDRSQIKQSGKDTDLDLAKRIVLDTETAKAVQRTRSRIFSEQILEPRRFKERKGTKGFIGDLEPLTKDDVKAAVFGNLMESHRYMAENLLRKRFLQEEIQALAKDFPAMAEEIDRLITLSAGRKTEAVRRLEEPINKLLAPFFGGDSASEIARLMNKAIFTVTLGAGDVGFPVLNALTAIQTVLPEISMVTRAPSRDLMKYYSWDLVKRGGGMDTLASANPFKIATQAMKELIKSDTELRVFFKELSDIGAVAPRFVEEFVGKVGQPFSFSAAKEGVSSGRAFMEWIGNMNKFLPARSEEFARLHAAAVGRIIGRDFYGHEGEKLLAFTKQFIERTMYNYGTMDRAAVMTGAFGQAFGLFKNWTFHYLANMSQYAGQGFSRGNWAPLLWAMGGTGSVAGLVGIPGFFAANGLSRLFTDKPLMDHLYGAMGYSDDSIEPLGAGGKIVDALYYGFPALANVSLSARAGAPGADAVRDVNTLFSVASFDRMSALAQFGQQATDQMFIAGSHPGQSRSTMDQFWRFAMPRTMYRFYQSAANDAVRSLRTGNQLVDNIGMIERVAFTLGITPLRVQKAFDVNSEGWREQNKMKEAVMVLGEEYGEALERDDPREIQRLIQRAFELGVPIQSVIQSGQANYLNRNQDQLDRKFKSYRIEKLKGSIGLD